MIRENAILAKCKIAENLSDGYETAIIDLEQGKYTKYGSYRSIDEIEQNFSENIELIMYNNDNIKNVVEDLIEIF